MENEYLKIAKQTAQYGAVQNVMHLVNEECLYRQHKRQQKGKATGMDGMTKEEYEVNAKKNIHDLVSRMKSFSYRPLPVKRVYIPKIGSDKLRPLGLPSYEDKLVQGAMAEILNAVYEPKFLDCSFGFRPKRSCHDAIKTLTKVIMCGKVNWVVDADIKGFFDNVNHDWLMKFLEYDIKDKNFLRYIKRFLIGGVMDKNQFIDSDKGAPQGGLISPILANVYLHYVLDLWFEKFVRSNMKGAVKLIRYADDFVCCFQYEREAKRFFEMLRERLEKFELQMSEEKSKLIRFGRFAEGSKDTFDFLGFRHINAKSREGKYIVHTRTSKAKMKAKKQAVSKWLKENRHIGKHELIKRLNVKLVGHYRYYGVSTNSKSVASFQFYVLHRLLATLNRRSQRKMSWEKFLKFMKHNPLAPVRIYVPLW